MGSPAGLYTQCVNSRFSLPWFYLHCIVGLFSDTKADDSLAIKAQHRKQLMGEVAPNVLVTRQLSCHGLGYGLVGMTQETPTSNLGILDIKRNVALFICSRKNVSVVLLHHFEFSGHEVQTRNSFSLHVSLWCAWNYKAFCNYLHHKTDLKTHIDVIWPNCWLKTDMVVLSFQQWCRATLNRVGQAQKHKTLFVLDERFILIRV